MKKILIFSLLVLLCPFICKAQIHKAQHNKALQKNKPTHSQFYCSAGLPSNIQGKIVSKEV